MLEYDRIDISGGIAAINKTNAPNECDTCHYWYFFDRSFKYECLKWLP